MATFGNSSTSTTNFQKVGGDYRSNPLYPPETVEVDSISIYCRADWASGNPQSFAGHIFNSGYAYVGDYGGITLTGGDGWAWRSMTSGAPVTLTGGATYYIQFSGGTSSYEMRLSYTGSASNNIGFKTSYGLPATIYFAGTFSNLFYYTPSGPSIEVEGITPGKVEFKEWGDIADIK